MAPLLKITIVTVSFCLLLATLPLAGIADPFHSSSTDIEIGEGEGNQITIKGDCAKVQEQKAAFENWQNTYLLDHQNGPAPEIQKQTDGSCLLDIRYYLPQRFVEYFSSNLALLDPIHEGPNCFASTWRLNGFLKTYLQASSYNRDKETGELKEFYQGFANAGACTVIQKPQDAKAGDVMLVLNARGTPTHGFVYISSSIGLSKFGSAGSGSFMIVSPREQARMYNNTTYDSGKGLKIFRCPKLREVVMNRSRYLQPHLVSIMDQYEALALSIETQIFSTNKLDPTLKSTWEKKARQLAEDCLTITPGNAIDAAMLAVVRQGLWNLTRLQ